MKIDLLDVNDNVITIVDTDNPVYEFEHFKAMLPDVVTWRQHVVVETLEQAKARYVSIAGAEFASKRDAVTWTQHEVGLYGYDRKPEDVTNFLAAMKRAELGLDTGFNVYVGSIGPKQFLPHTYEMFKIVLEQSANEQISAYQWYEGIKGQLQAAEGIEELEQIYSLGGE